MHTYVHTPHRMNIILHYLTVYCMMLTCLTYFIDIIYIYYIHTHCIALCYFILHYVTLYYYCIILRNITLYDMI